jgi:hypothetical protein
MSRTTIGWAAAALAGLLLAAGVTLAASSLTSQRVGLSGEPPSAGRDLVVSTPARTTTAPRKAPGRAKRKTPPAPARTTTVAPPTASAPVPQPTTTTDDHGGSSGSSDGGGTSGRGRGRGGGSDD